MNKLKQKKLSFILLVLTSLVLFAGCQQNQNQFGKVKSVRMEPQEEKLVLIVVTEELNKDVNKIKSSLTKKGLEVKTKQKKGKTVFGLVNWMEHPELFEKLGISKYTSEHFEYYTLGSKDKTEKLESIYQTLTDKLLKFYGPTNVEEKIKYMALPSEKYGGKPYALWGDVNMVVDPWDCSSSHELIHLLAPVRKTAFSEGLAQGLQREGNEIMKDQNVNLNTKKYLQDGSFTNLDTIIQSGTAGIMNYYHQMGSFVYYNIYIMDKDKQFGEFLRALEDDSLAEVKRKYEDIMERDFDTVVEEWKEWVKGIDKNSDVYVKWK